MMNRSMFLRLLSLLLCMGIAGLTLRAGDNSLNQPASEKLAGSQLSMEEALTKSSSVFTGQVEEMGLSVLQAWHIHFHEVNVKELKVIKGTGAAQIELEVTTSLKWEETRPKVGSTYIFFVEKREKWNFVLKMLPATESNISAIPK
ncbi:MAG: hypothetical protein ABIP97_06055 [Chthoniobacterales bacterium]